MSQGIQMYTRSIKHSKNKKGPMPKTKVPQPGPNQSTIEEGPWGVKQKTKPKVSKNSSV